MTCCVYPCSPQLLTQVVNLTQFIDCSVSLLLCNELLLSLVHGVVSDSQPLVAASGSVLESQEELRGVEKHLVDCLYNYSSQECSAWSAESVEVLMGRRRQVCHL